MESQFDYIISPLRCASVVHRFRGHDQAVTSSFCSSFALWRSLHIQLNRRYRRGSRIARDLSTYSLYRRYEILSYTVASTKAHT
jgi:hypothetical protein